MDKKSVVKKEAGEDTEAGVDGDGGGEKSADVDPKVAEPTGKTAPSQYQTFLVLKWLTIRTKRTNREEMKA